MPCGRLTAVFLISILVPVVTPSAFAGEVYRWLDARGLVHFGRNPPPGVDAEPVAPPDDDPLPPSVTAPTEGIRRWRDDDGIVHFGDRPPQGVGSRAVTDPARRNVVSGLSRRQRGMVRRFDRRMERRGRAHRELAARHAERKRRRRKRCRELEEKVDELRERRRGGLSLSESNRVRDRLLELGRERTRECR